MRYPVVEAITALLTVAVAVQFGVSWQAVAAMFFTWCLVALTLIDLDKQLLPDNITLPLLWLGLLLSLFTVFVDVETSIIGAIAGYMILWSVFQLFKLVTGKEGMGHGDFKLLAALGAWCGWELIPQIILLSSLVGAISGIAMMLFAGHERRQPIPFGPYLAAAGWIAMMWGEQINAAYLGIL
jgi:leader peptidase (prepilin peptidase)/N-methyltransferase